MFDGSVRGKIDRITAGLEADCIAPGEGVQALHKVLHPVFRKARKQLAVPGLLGGTGEKRGKSGEWWSAECAGARHALLSYMAALPRGVGSPQRTPEQQAVVRALRSDYQRQRRAAQQEWRATGAVS